MSDRNVLWEVNISLGNERGISASYKGPLERREEEMPVCWWESATSSPFSVESSPACCQGLFAFGYLSEALVEIQSLNIEGKAGDTKITLLLLTPNHTHSDR